MTEQSLISTEETTETNSEEVLADSVVQPNQEQTETVDNIDNEVFDKMVPLFKQLNYTEEKAREVLNKISSGEEVEALSSEEGLIFGKYKDVEAAQTAFKTLESENGRLRREKKPEAPDEYSFDFSEDENLSAIMEGVDLSQDPLMKELSPVMKEAGITQEQAKALVKAKLNFDKSMLPDVDGEIAKLGAEGPQVLAQVETFVQKNYTPGDQDILANIATSAEGVMFIKNNLMGSKKMPGENINTTTESSADILAKAQELKSTENFKYNTSAISRYDALMDKASKLQLKGL